MFDKIKAINKQQLESKRPVVSKERARFDWEDTSLLPLLSEDIKPYYPYLVADKPNPDEEDALSIANELVAAANKTRDIREVNRVFDDQIDAAREAVADKLRDFKNDLLNKVKRRKGILIHGEGGIGKTYFIYELANALSENDRKFVVAFNQSGVNAISDIGITEILKAFPNGFTILLDACNELDDESFRKARGIIRDALQQPNVNIIITTRTESPTSRLDELQNALPSYAKFGGVDPYMVFDLLSEYPDSILFQFQDMLFSRNPRNLVAITSMIKKLKPGKDRRGAITQRTALIENCFKEAVDDDHLWKQTKTICKHLYKTKDIGATRAEISQLLGSDVDSYITEMMEHGFLECYQHEPCKYYFSSESQIRIVVARSLNDDLNDLADSGLTNQQFAKKVAMVVVAHCTFDSSQEMVQVAVDRYIRKGPVFLAALLGELREAHVSFDEKLVLKQTIFPLDPDFSELTTVSNVNPVDAFVEFGGYLNTPFNLSNYSTNRLLNDQSAVDALFIDKWRSWELGELITRVKGKAEYIMHGYSIPSGAEEEWIWFSIWCSFSSNLTLRGLSQRLMFALCDSSEVAIQMVIDAWDVVEDIYARRAISKALMLLCDADRSGDHIRNFAERVREDPSVTDSIVIANICKLLNNEIGPMDFSAADIYEIYGKSTFSEKTKESFESLAWTADLLNKDCLPFDIYSLRNGEVSLGYSSSFLATPSEKITKWNEAISELLDCPVPGKCSGWSVDRDTVEGFLPIGFEAERLDPARLFNCMVALTKKWIEAYGGNLESGLGTDYAYHDEGQNHNMPVFKPLDLASCELLGSLSANYYLDEIVLANDKQPLCGFAQYEEPAYNEPGEIHAPISPSSVQIDSAKAKLSGRIISPAGKSLGWFDDADEAFQEMLDTLKPIRIGKAKWQPIAVSTQIKIRKSSKPFDKLMRSNEILVSCALDTAKHIEGTADDRYLTIEHKEYLGNMKDFGESGECECLDLKPIDRHCVTEEKNRMLLPPPSLVKRLNLEYNPKTASFINHSGESIILCDGSPGNYYEESVHHPILIRQDVFERIDGANKVTFFAFTERFNEETGYVNNCEKHWEFRLNAGQPVSFPNAGGQRRGADAPEKCRKCYFGRESKTAGEANSYSEFSDSELTEYFELVKKYTVNDKTNE